MKRDCNHLDDEGFCDINDDEDDDDVNDDCSDQQYERISSSSSQYHVINMSHSTKKLLIRRWIDIISSPRYAIYNIDNHHQCHLEKPLSSMKKRFNSVDNFFGCIKCGKYHICDSSSTDCLLMDDNTSECLICRYSGRSIKGLSNYGIGSYKESVEVQSDYLHRDFDSWVESDIKINIPTQPPNSPILTPQTQPSLSSLSPPPSSSSLDNTVSAFTLNVHQNKNGTTKSTIKKNLTSRYQQGGGGGCDDSTIYPSSSSSFVVRNDSGLNNVFYDKQKKKRYNPEDFINVTADKDLTEREKIDRIRTLSLQSTTNNVIIPLTTTSTTGLMALSQLPPPSSSPVVSNMPINDEYSFLDRPVKKKKENESTEEEYEESMKMDVNLSKLNQPLAFKNHHSGGGGGSNANNDENDDEYNEYDYAGRFCDMDNEDEGEGDNDEEQYDSGGNVYDDCEGGGGDDGNFDGGNKRNPFGSVYVGFKETLLSNNQLYHNNIEYWTHYYSWLLIDQEGNDIDYGDDTITPVCDKHEEEEPIEDLIDSLISQTYRKEKNEIEYSKHDSPSNNDNGVDHKEDADYDEDDENGEETIIQREEYALVTRIDTSFKNSLSSEVYARIDEEMNRLLVLLMCIYYEKRDDRLESKDSLFENRKTYQTWATQLKSYYMPIISKIIILLYNSPHLLEWEKDKNEKHQKQVKSSSSTKVGVTITNMNHLEAIEKNIENSMDTLLCPTKITAALLLKHFINEYYLIDATGNRITIWAKDIWLNIYSIEGCIEHLLSQEFNIPTSFTTSTSYPMTTTSIMNSYGKGLKKNVDEYTKVIKTILQYYQSDPIWLKAFIFD
jgi:hypothetical protein